MIRSVYIELIILLLLLSTTSIYFVKEEEDIANETSYLIFANITRVKRVLKLYNHLFLERPQLFTSDITGI